MTLDFVINVKFYKGLVHKNHRLKYKMDLLKAEIERKKRQLDESQVLVPGKKYFKRGDLAKHNQQSFYNRNSYDVENSSSNEEVIRRLRDRGEPILLFGETELEAYQRLKRHETLEPDVNKGQGGQNDFKAALDKVDQEYLNELIKTTDGAAKSNDVAFKDDGTTLEDIEKMKKELGQINRDWDQEIVLRFLKYILKLWGEELNSRTEDQKRTMKGKMGSATHTQTVAYLKPLFRKLKQKKVEEDILESMVEIVKYIMNRDYIKANDAYLEMAIGNAPWPIGVTMVGIHARTGREKISSRYVAHVLNDETQRKYIQALKRLMTQCQHFFPTDPSRSVNYESIHSV
ncbi:pre-mRNA-splicing factor 18 isoform X2 [Octopus sinensis]|uniref:Pre-mRNA-splicing factor 18 n=1 Tax=Octopus sinensis TaxID=2607531 RepID=A0A7E6ES01_9MOLL|nr:pre-mRNA-splicing factor 18 isoform X2 [Octopus sinensis]